MKGKFYQSVKGKILMMGALGIIAALIIGMVGVTSINRNQDLQTLQQNLRTLLMSSRKIWSSSDKQTYILQGGTSNWCLLFYQMLTKENVFFNVLMCYDGAGKRNTSVFGRTGQ